MSKHNRFGYTEPRPVLITIICIVGFLLTLGEVIAILFIPQVSFELAMSYGTHHPLATLIIDGLTLISYIGIWQMRLWGLFLFGFIAVGIAVYGFFIDTQFWWSYGPAIVILLICIYYIKHMK